MFRFSYSYTNALENILNYHFYKQNMDNYDKLVFLSGG
jgi:hypothetical protein